MSGWNMDERHGEFTEEARGGWRSATSPPSADELAETLLLTARSHLRGNRAVARKCVAELRDGRSGAQPRTVGVAADLALQKSISQLWQFGWLPVDLWQITRRRMKDIAEGLVIDTIAANLAQYAPATVPERWTEQLRQLNASVWWDRGQPHHDQWAKKAGVGGEEALLTVISVLASFMAWPRLPVIAPLPGTAAAQRSVAARGIDQKVLARVRGLLAKAEATTFPAEAETLSAKAQELMNRHSFERALLDEATHQQQTATSSRLWLDGPYFVAKATLVNVIAQANRSRAVRHGKLGFVSLVGDQLDLEITELLATSLLVQATTAMVAEGKQVTRAGTSRTRSFRQSFLVAYARRIGERLEAANTAARADAHDPRLLPVLADRSRAVDQAFDEMFGATVRKAVSVSNGAGWQAGRAAADRADIGVDRATLAPR
ncbi:MAG: DUF2786 domain-containing protein [Pseudonocardiaceae bacterium]|nr:DUF2786 domain-containing protein [Pseudonocardiaceae bacterium]